MARCAVKKKTFIFGLALCFQTATALPSGFLRSSTDYFPHDLGEPTSTLLPYLQVEVSDKQRLSREWRWQYKVMALGNLESDHKPEQIFADLPEGFLEMKRGAWRVRAGANTLNWAVVDVASPSDVVNPLVILGPTRTFKRASPMLESLWSNDHLSVHGVYIPWQMRPLLPASDSRWLPRSLLVNTQGQGVRVILPPQLEYDYNSPESLSGALTHNFGAKVSVHHERWDIQAVYFQGASTSPKVRADVDSDVGSTDTEIIARTPIRLTNVAYRVGTTGLGVVWAGDSWILRGESAYQQTISDSAMLQPWSWSNVFAVETKTEIQNSSITWLGQYYYTKNPQSADNFVSSSYRLFDNTFGLGARWAYSDAVTLTGTALIEMQTRGVFWSLGFDNSYSDHLKWGMSWRDISAAKEGLLKTFARNDYATLDLTYFF